jgi:hypothetical protein
VVVVGGGGGGSGDGSSHLDPENLSDADGLHDCVSWCVAGTPLFSDGGHLIVGNGTQLKLYQMKPETTKGMFWWLGLLQQPKTLAERVIDIARARMCMHQRTFLERWRSFKRIVHRPRRFGHHYNRHPFAGTRSSPFPYVWL